METTKPYGVICSCEIEEDSTHLLTYLKGVLDVLSEEGYLVYCRFPTTKASLLLRQLGVYHQLEACMEEAFHDLVWNTEEGDGAVSLWVIQRLIRLRESNDFGSSLNLQELRHTETEGAEGAKPLCGFATLVQDELGVDLR